MTTDGQANDTATGAAPTGEATPVTDDDLEAVLRGIKNDSNPASPAPDAGTSAVDTGVGTDAPVELTDEELENLTDEDFDKIPPKERSKLGRRVKVLRDKLAKENAELKARLEEKEKAPPAPAAPTEKIPMPDFEARFGPEPECPEIVTTPEDYRAVRRYDDYQAEKAKYVYENNYANAFMEEGEDDPDYQEVFNLMYSTPDLNSKSHDDPSAAARINYARAKARLVETRFKNRPAESQVPGRRDSATGTAVPVASSNAAPPAKPPVTFTPEVEKMIDAGFMTREDALRYAGQ